LVTVTGRLLHLQELAELVRVLARYCEKNSYSHLSDPVRAMEQNELVKLSDPQLAQLVQVIAGSLPAAAQLPDGAAASLEKWVGGDGARLFEAVRSAFVGLHARVDVVETERLRGEREREERGPSPMRDAVEGLDLPSRFYLAAHKVRTGDPLLPERVIGLGLSAAVLAELLAERRLRVGSAAELVEVSLPRHGESEPVAGVAGRVLEQIAVEPEPAVLGDWLAFLAGSLPEMVRAELLGRGVLDVVARRWPWLREQYPPARAVSTFAVLDAAVMDAARRDGPGFLNRLLLGIATATTLTGAHHEWAGIHLTSRQAISIDAPNSPALLLLLEHLAGAVNAAVSTHQI
jgi:Golgi phosphoprotein 3 (GPP34)